MRKILVSLAAAAILAAPAPAMAAKATYDVMTNNGVILLENVSLKEAVSYVAAPEVCGGWLTVVYGGVDAKAITREVKQNGTYECHSIGGDPIYDDFWIGQASA
jgi:hypothetical protein